MAANEVTLKCVVIGLILTASANGLNLGLIAGDNKSGRSPVIIKKVTHKSPVFINVHNKPSLGSLIDPLPKLPKPPPSLSSLKLKSSLRKLRSPLIPKTKLPKLPPLPKTLIPPLIPRLPLLPKPLIPRLPLIPKPLIPRLPLIPKPLPLLPLLPPILPPLPLLPILPPPILPPPILPLLPRLKPLSLSSVKLPSLKNPLALGSELNPVIVPSSIIPCQSETKDVLSKLRKLRRIGSLTTAEFTKFKKLLLKRK